MTGTREQARTTRTAPWWVLVLAASFFAYFILLAYCDLWRPEDHGFAADFATSRMVLTQVIPGSPGDHAGLRPGDVILSADGKALQHLLDWTVIDTHVEFNRPIQLTIERGNARFDTMVVLARAPWSYWSTEPGIFLLIVLVVQLVALVLALIIVMKRPDDGTARLGALVLATVGVFKIVLPYRITAVWHALPSVLGAFLWIPHVSEYAVAAVLFTFFASFPRRLVRSAGTWMALWTPMLLALVLPVRQEFQSMYAPAQSTALPFQGLVLTTVTAAYTIGGLSALLVNYGRLSDLNERRRVKVLVVGAIGGLAPGFLVVAYYWLQSSGNFAQSIFASRATSVGTLTLLFFPASFTYAILRHRLFDITVIIRQGVQYALARRMLGSLVPALAGLLAADVLLHRTQSLSSILETRGWAYLVVAALAAVAWARRQRWLSALDRRFFREQYNAQQILRRVAEDLRRVGDFDLVAPRVVAQIHAALHPEFVALVVREPHEVLYRPLVATPPTLAAPLLRVDSTLVSLMRLLGKPMEVSAGHAQWLAQQLPPEEVEFLRQTRIELLVPIVTHPDRAESVLVLGLKRSEEPYTREDSDLLAIIAASLALLLERTAAPPPAPADLVEECPECGTCYDSGTVRCEREGQPLVQLDLARVLAARYQLDRRLGRGGLGTVYAALDTALDRKVAVKVIRDDLLASNKIAIRFQREARIAAAFTHPNVVTVHDFGVTGTRAFLVMELLSGATLRDTLSGRGPLALATTLKILRHVCAAVEAAHRRQLVHRDLKPENIFLVGPSPGELTKVLDFGIAKFLPIGTLGTARETTGTGVLLGTLPYMAPEHLRGEEVQPACDLWALAVIAHEMLTGVHPFAMYGAGGVPIAHPGRPDPGAAGLSSAAGRFFQRALAIEPHERPDTPGTFLADLERAFAAA
jgi:serine/threonine-protein kinase